MNYKKARDCVWKLLIKHKIKELPIKLADICEAENIKIVSYEDSADIIEHLGLQEKCKENDGFTISGKIFYNSGVQLKDNVLQ